MHANQLADLLGTTQITSSDYNSVKALVRGEIDTYMGFQFHTIGDRDEGGLAVVSNERPVFVWHKNAVALAVGIDIRTTIDWIAEKRSWLVSADFSAGAVTIDEEGLVEISAYEA
jgi:tRNA U34 2-thiouridine synthase MnmA/TrmU